MLAFVDFYFNYYTWLDALLAVDQEYMSLPAEHFCWRRLIWQP